ncbi:MAG TPA: hypothetical protein VKU01_00095 [Bryobacteraceae bacterium]|nr:hypothetical protein [Bryobacteraceae bacterium]
MQNEYTVPELRYIGDACDVIRGAGLAGIEIDNQVMVDDMEFEAD